ncbi:MAG: hypothetical protein H7Z72_25440 [Bacteroidetes bacterium]|nr:hypothetical protein [Fibrella sp.]
MARLDKAKPVFVYCLSGGRTKKAAEQMRTSGYGPVYELDGGYLKWTMRMKPVEGVNRSAPATAALTPAQLTPLTTANSIVLVDVSAPWCGPSKRMMPAVEKLKTEYAGKVQIITVNADQAKALLTAYQVEEIPTLLLFRQGKLVGREVGYRDETALRQRLNQQ